MLWWMLATVAWALPGPVRDAVEVGDCPSVQAALPSPSTDAERLAVGWCQRDTAGGQALLAKVGGPLAPWARWTRAQELLDAGHAAKALAALKGLTLPAGPGLRVRLDRDHALVALHHSLQARPDLRELLHTAVGIEARYWLAVGGEQRGDKAATIATYRRVWADDARGPWADLSAKALARLGAPVPDFTTREGRALAMDRVHALEAVAKHAAARTLLEGLGQAKAVVTPKTGLVYAEALMNARDYQASVKAFAAVLGQPANAKGDADPLFDYALATSRTGHYTDATTIYRRVFTLHPDSAKGDLASFKLGYLEYDHGHCDTASKLFAEHMKRMPDSHHYDEALWFTAWCGWKTGDLAAATAAWQTLVEKRPDSPLVAGALYWQARVKGRQGDADGEAKGLADVLANYPLTAYAWFAAQRLGKTFPAQEVAAAPSWPPALAKDPAVLAAQALLAAGFPAWARAELDTVSAPEDDAGRLAYALARFQAGDYRGAQALVTDCPAPNADASPALRAVCVPRPAASIVAAVAKRYGVPADLPYAIMIAESNLDPSVTSVAGARGLMQLMPTEAVKVHADLYGQAPYDPARLYDAPYNAALGTAELGLKKQAVGDVLKGSDLPAIIAAYNGGEGAVKRWAAAAGDPPDPDEFTEDIGYTETRQYVKRVLGYLMAYEWAYGG